TDLRTPVCILYIFSSRRRHTRFSRDWSSDVCSSDLVPRRVRRVDNAYALSTGGSLGVHRFGGWNNAARPTVGTDDSPYRPTTFRSEERRVGKEWRRRRWADPSNKSTSRNAVPTSQAR